jgi:hypothetical protein
LSLTKTSNTGVTDRAGNSLTGGNVGPVAYTIDKTPPTAVDVQATNDSGGTVGKPETGDKITYTFSEAMKASSILSGWNGSSTNVTVHLDRGGNANVMLTVKDSTDATLLNLGTVDLGRSDYLASTGTKHASFTGSTMVMSGSTITITLGTPAGDTIGTAASTGTMTWTPSTSATDPAGNPMSSAAATEGGTADKEF